jgi:hypothetical protein
MNCLKRLKKKVLWPKFIELTLPSNHSPDSLIGFYFSAFFIGFRKINKNLMKSVSMGLKKALNTLTPI